METQTDNGLHYFAPEGIRPTDERLAVDLCVYGATAGGCVAALQAARLGLSVALLQPGRHLGGMTTGGLGWTDFGRRHVIGGLARQFYRDVGAAYGKPEEWQFEPHVATAVLARWIIHPRIAIRMGQYLERTDRREGREGRIEAIHLHGGLQVAARMFIDATYEGDLMAQAGVTYTVGREPNARYGETLNGIQVRAKHQFSHPVDPYATPGDPGSGLLPGIVDEDLSRRAGEGDARIQAYCFRMCLTDDPALRLPWEKPAGYDPRAYILATRWFQGAKDAYNDLFPGYDPAYPEVPRKFDVLPNLTPGGFHKTDTNNHGPVSSDFIGANHAWPEAGYAERERIFQQHVRYQVGFYWHMANAPDIPARYRQAFARWGLARDEFADTAHWPHQLYVREARRLVGAYVLTEHDCRQARTVTDPVGAGSYAMDSHNCTRFVTRDAQGRTWVRNEGDVQVDTPGPYGIAYRSIVPAPGECPNLLVPVCLSASHIAYGSIRMEPVFMVLGQSAATAAAIAIADNLPIQAVPYPRLREQLQTQGQALPSAG